MPIAKLRMLPGVDVVETPTYNAAQISVSNLIAFYGGLPQKRKGWVAMTTTPLTGTCSGLHGWADIIGNPYLAAGTEQRLEVLIGGELADITPIEETTNITPAFTTVMGSADVTVEDNDYGPSVGDWINIQTQVSVGGLILFGMYQVQEVLSTTEYVIDAGSAASASVSAGGVVPEYSTTNGFPDIEVTLPDHGFSAGDTFEAAVSTTVATVEIFGAYEVDSVVDADTFVIIANSSANATTTAFENSGDARIAYLLPTGATSAVGLSGYGIGDYGAGDYGLANPGQAIEPLRQWSLDNFGQVLIACPTNNAIFYWEPPDPEPATIVSVDAPIFNTMVFCMSQAQIVVALGSEVGGVREPLLVRWCDAGDFTVWTPAADNQAGSFMIPQGSRLVGGMPTGLGALLWTDIGVYQMIYQGLPFIFGFRPIATGCGLIGQRAVASIGQQIMWMSTNGFFLMVPGGTPGAIECPVWDIVANNADFTQPGQFVMGANSLTNEFELFFPLAATSDYYVEGVTTRGSAKFNFVEKVWDYSITSQLQRTAWEGRSAVGNPVGADLSGLLQQHEIGYDANGAAINWSWQTGFFDLAEGEEFVFIDWIIPDFVYLNDPTIALEVLIQGYPNIDPIVVGPFYITQQTAAVPPFGARGRQAALRVSGSDLGTFNRLGAVRYRFAPDGRA